MFLNLEFFQNIPIFCVYYNLTKKKQEDIHNLMFKITQNVVDVMPIPIIQYSYSDSSFALVTLAIRWTSWNYTKNKEKEDCEE